MLRKSTLPKTFAAWELRKRPAMRMLRISATALCRRLGVALTKTVDELRMACMSKWTPRALHTVEGSWDFFGSMMRPKKVHAAPESPDGRRSQTPWLNQEIVVEEAVDY